MIRQVQRQKDGDDAKRRYAVGDAQSGGRRVGGRWRGRFVAREPGQCRHDKPEYDPHPDVGHRVVQHVELDAERY